MRTRDALLALALLLAGCSLGASPSRFLATADADTPAEAGAALVLVGGEEPAPALRRPTAAALVATWKSDRSDLASFTPGFALPQPGAYVPLALDDASVFVGAATERDEAAPVGFPTGPLVIVRSSRNLNEGWAVGAGPAIPSPRATLAASGSFVFVVGSASSYVAQVDAKTLGAGAFRKLGKPLATPRAVPSVCFVGADVYAVGGETPPDEPSAAVDHTRLDPATGDLGAFAAQRPLTNKGAPSAVVGATCVGAQGRLYVLGGASVDTVLSAAIGEGGVLEPWRDEAPLPTPLFGGSAVVRGNELIVVGGVKAGGALSDRVHVASISTAGALTWRTLDRILPRAVAFAGVRSF